MSRELKISVGQHSDKGRKETNQDFHGVLVPEEPLLGLKGIAIVLADGISSSPVSRIAAESAVKGFLTDYYCTSESWSVKTSAQRVLAATNAWLHAQTRRSQHAYDAAQTHPEHHPEPPDVFHRGDGRDHGDQHSHRRSKVASTGRGLRAEHLQADDEADRGDNVTQASD